MSHHKLCHKLCLRENHLQDYICILQDLARIAKSCKRKDMHNPAQILQDTYVILQDLCKKCLSCKACDSCKDYIKTHDSELRGQEEAGHMR